MKTPIYTNRPIDFNVLSDREFEEINYHFFKEQIDNGLFRGIYDSVIISAGVGERGCDVGPYLNGKIYGCVQCKKYNSNVTFKVVFDDIIKFSLHHILETEETGSDSTTLIHNLDNFTYYISVSKGFTQPAIPLIQDFNSQWSKQKVEETAKSQISKSVKLNNIDFEDYKERLEEVLNKLKVVSIVGLDIEKVIRSNHKITGIYFEIGNGTNKEDSDNIKKIKNSLVLKKMTGSELTSKAEEISGDILSVKSHFGGILSNTIKRKEVKILFDWILEPFYTDNPNISVISGNAGLGKSVIVLQLYEKLLKEKIPVVCLKADRLAFDTIKELENEMNLTVEFNEFFEQLMETESRGVLLIDQIDALSQTLSSNLKPLNVYDRIIRKVIQRNPKVKIVISCRIYDLNYDPIISSYKGTKNVVVSPLDSVQVVEVLKKSIGDRVNNFSSEIVKLLSIPLHLDVFLKVNSKQLDLTQITGVQDLYDVLWRQKVVGNLFGKGKELDFSKVTKLIYAVSSKMYELQQINVSVRSFEDEYPQEISYLKSEGIIYGNKKIEFFHQSFFDYSFARNFISQDKDLIVDLLSRHQGLFVRSKVKQIINFKRNDHPIEYIELIDKLVQNDGIRFHLKLLALQQIGFQETPTVQEVNFIKVIFRNQPKLKDIFLTLYLGVGWLKIIIKEGLLENDIKLNYHAKEELIRNFFRRFVNRENEVLLEYYLRIKNLKNTDDLIIDLLWGTKEFISEKSLELADYIITKKGTTISDTLFYFLDNAVKHFPDWTVGKVINLVNISENESSIGEDDFFPGRNHHSQLYASLWKYHPRKAYLLVKYIVVEIIKSRSYPSSNPGRKVIVNKAFLLYGRTDLSIYYHFEQLDKLQSYLINEFNNDIEFVRNEVRFFLNSWDVTNQSIALSIIECYPANFLIEIKELYEHKNKLRQFFGLNLYLNYLILSVLKKSFTSLDDTSLVKDVILNFYLESELKLIDYGDGKKVKNRSYGHSKLKMLSSLPKIVVEADTDFKTSLAELNRKFGKQAEVEAPVSTEVLVGGKTLDSNAYENMSFEDWKKTFRKYTIQNTDYDSWNDPDELSHGRMFSDYVSRKPDVFVGMINELLIDDTIPKSYKIKGLEGLKEGRFEAVKLLELFKVAIVNNEFSRVELLNMIWVSSYFAENKIIDKDILRFLKDKSSIGSEKNGFIDDSLTMGINSVRGAAVSNIMDYSFSEETKNFVFESLEGLIDNSSPGTRACDIYKLQNFIKYDKKQTLDICLKLCYDYAPGVVKIALSPLQYLISFDFNIIRPFLINSMKNDANASTVGHLLTKAYCFEYDGANELIEQFDSLGKIQKNAVAEIAWKFIKKNSHLDRAIELIKKYIDVDDKDLANTYSHSFYHLDVEVFLKIFEFLKMYVNSEVGKNRDQAFYMYLKKCSNDYPEECIELTKGFNNNSSENNQRRLYRNEPLNVIVQSYNSIRDYNSKSKSLEDAMNVFDELIENSEYRSGAYEILNKLDTY